MVSVRFAKRLSFVNNSKQYDKLFVLLINKNIKKARVFFVVFDLIRKITAYLDQKLENCLYILILYLLQDSYITSSTILSFTSPTFLSHFPSIPYSLKMSFYT